MNANNAERLVCGQFSTCFPNRQFGRVFPFSLGNFAAEIEPIDRSHYVIIPLIGPVDRGVFSCVSYGSVRVVVSGYA